jgi:hypothetical protein
LLTVKEYQLENPDLKVRTKIVEISWFPQAAEGVIVTNQIPHFAVDSHFALLTGFPQGGLSFGPWPGGAKQGAEKGPSRSRAESARG